MDASGAVYPLFPNHVTPLAESPTNARQCSSRGCTLIITGDLAHKMCDTCRSRHRIYASKKRAKRNTEKAGSAIGSVALAPGSETPLGTSESPSVLQECEWVVTTQENYQERLPPLSFLSRNSPPQTPWQIAIDPQLSDELTGSGGSFYHTLRPLPMSSTSALATTSAFPTTASELQIPPDTVEPSLLSDPSSQIQLSRAIDEENATQSTPQDPRPCSAKGCKGTIPEHYDFKMCPPCRERYRIYGNTKRAKRKYERDAFRSEMKALRAAEDEKRMAQGLGPLSDNPDELRAWELSILDEEIPQPPLSTTELGSNSSTAVPMSVSSSLLGEASSTIDSPTSIPPLPHPTDPSLGAMMPSLPARMCIVAHCHRIMPGSYRYKRCEQHRLQNRHHDQSKLKRVRRNKSQIAEAEGRTATDEGAQQTQSGIGDRVKKVRKRKEKDGMQGEGGAAAAVDVDPIESAASKGLPAPMKTQRGPKHVCATTGCHNLLVPDQRWRTCDECRDAERQRRLAVRADLKAAESVYWKGVAESMSAARKLEAEKAVGSESGGVQHSENGAPADMSLDAESSRPIDIDGGEQEEEEEDTTDADAEGDPESGLEEVHEARAMPSAPPAPLSAPFVDPDPTMGRVLVWKSEGRSELSTEAWSNGFSKFRVAVDLPAPSPSSVEELARPQGLIVPDVLELRSSQARPRTFNETQAETSDPKPIATATIPYSAPFVYTAPNAAPKAKRSAPSTAKKGKAKAKASSSRTSASTSTAGTTVPVTMSPSYASLYGFPPSYPYYPYHTAAHSIPPNMYPHMLYPNPNERPPPPQGATPPNFFPYPYPPNAYGYAPGAPPGMAFLPPRHTGAAGVGMPYGPPTSVPLPLQGFSPMPGSVSGYPFYPYPGLPPASASAVLPASAPQAQRLPPVPHLSLPVPAEFETKGDGEVGTSVAGASLKRKQSGTDGVGTREIWGGPSSSTTGDSAAGSDTSASAAIATPVQTTPVPEATSVPSDGRDGTVGTANDDSDTPSATQLIPRTCSARLCQRKLPLDVSGNICEKCKLKFRKHQAKTKQRFKLEPRKFLLDKSAGRKDDDEVMGNVDV